jgi:hypothetical protein
LSLADRRRDGSLQQHREVAACELRADAVGVPRLGEEVRVGVECEARSCVPKDAAYLGDVEADVDDQVAAEGVAQIVEANAPPVPVEARSHRGAPEDAPGDVVTGR